MITISRKLTKYRATLCKVVKDGAMRIEEVGSADYFSTSANRAVAIKELKAAGYEVPKGAIIDVAVIETIKYECTLDSFLTVAVPVNE